MKILVDSTNYKGGVISIDGSKNASLAIIPAVLLSNSDVIEITNLPNISDIKKQISILEYLGVETFFNGKKLVVKKSNIEYRSLDITVASEIRASYYYMGIFLALFDKVEISYPGGCDLGERPIDIHVDSFKQLGYEIDEDECIKFKKTDNTNNVIKILSKSVGASINTIYASINKTETIEIYGILYEPEVNEVINFLKVLGYNIDVINSVLYVYPGISTVENIYYKVIPDRIEALSYIVLGGIHGNLIVNNFNYEHIDTTLKTLKNAGLKYKLSKRKSSIQVKKSLYKAIDFKTGTYPSIPTDIQQILTVFLTQAEGISRIKDVIYSNRINHINELKKMGVNICTNNGIVYVRKSSVAQTTVEAKDLRGGFALLLAATMANNTVVDNFEIVLRGYSNVVKKFFSIGIDLTML